MAERRNPLSDELCVLRVEGFVCSLLNFLAGFFQRFAGFFQAFLDAMAGMLGSLLDASAGLLHAILDALARILRHMLEFLPGASVGMGGRQACAEKQHAGGKGDRKTVASYHGGYPVEGGVTSVAKRRCTSSRAAVKVVTAGNDACRHLLQLTCCTAFFPSA